ncbi:MAG: hypothetical protein R3D59_18150 [Paracoccaceae bacterium]
MTPGRVSQWKHPDENILRDDAFTKPGRKGKIVVDVALDQVRRNRDIGQALGNGIATRTEVRDRPPDGDRREPAGRPARRTGGVQATRQEDEGQTKAGATPGQTTGEQAGSGGRQTRSPQTSSEPNRPSPPPEHEEPGAGADVDLMDQDRPRILTVEDELKATRLERERIALRRQREEDAQSRGLLMSADDVRDQMAGIAGRMMRVFEGALPDFASAVAEQFGVPQRDVVHLLRTQFAKVRAAASAKERAAAASEPRMGSAQVDSGE